MKGKIKIKVKSENERIKPLNEGKINDKNEIVPFNHISLFRQAGSNKTEMLEKIGGTDGTCMDSPTPSTSRSKLGTGWKGVKCREVERSKEPTGTYS